MGKVGSLRSSPSALQIVAAFAAVYIIWGSTYFAIAEAIKVMPPLLMAGTRFLVAGALLYIFLRLRGVKRPKLMHWWSALIIGGLLLLGGNGAVSYAEQFVASGVVSLIVAMVPIYVVLLDWLRPGGRRPSLLGVVGLIVGFAGVGLLFGPDILSGGAGFQVAALIPLVGSLAWAAGSLYSRSAKLPAAPLMATATEMLAGGVLLVGIGLALGEGSQVHPEKFTLNAFLAWGFLIVFGSIVAFSAYIWLLRVVAPARVSTYAFVNPVVAIFLGTWFLNEQITTYTIVAAAMILVAVAIITVAQASRSGKSASETGVQAPEAPPALPEPVQQDTAGNEAPREEAGTAGSR
jgi:drug/metabolite transporter (DMT)-like permease